MRRIEFKKNITFVLLMENNKNLATIFNMKIFLETITALQNKIKELEKRIEELELNNDIASDFNQLMRENAFSTDSLDDMTEMNAQYFRL